MTVFEGTMKQSALDSVRLKARSGERLVQGIVSTPRVDEDGDVLFPWTFDLSYYREINGKLLINHNPNLVIGSCRRIFAKGEDLYGLWDIGQGAVPDCGWDAITSNPPLLTHFSFRFVRVNRRQPTAEESQKYPGAKKIVEGGSVTEVSLVAYPANPSCIIEAFTKGRLLPSVAKSFNCSEVAIAMGPRFDFQDGKKESARVRRIHVIDD